MLTDKQRRLVTELLRERPFECQRVFFFDLSSKSPQPIDAESEVFYRRNRAIVDALPLCDVLQEWAGNIVEGARDDARAYFYASYRFDSLMVVVSKHVEVTGARVESPFDKYFVDAIAARIAPLVGPISAGTGNSESRKLPVGEKTTAFTELSAWRVCKNLWRQTYGPDVWIAVKDGQPVAFGKTAEDLDMQLRQKALPPPFLYVPPEHEKIIHDIFPATPL